MSVLIKGMKMPKCCEDCRLLYDCCSCIVTGYSMAMIGWKIEEKRLPDCPIIELPDHGDLIDKSELLKKEAFIGDTWSGGFAVLSEDIYSATAVIPAERNEE